MLLNYLYISAELQSFLVVLHKCEKLQSNIVCDDGPYFAMFLCVSD